MDSYDRQVEILFNKNAQIKEDIEQLYYLNKNKVDLDIMDSMQNDISGLYKRFDLLASTEFVHINDDIQHLYFLNKNKIELDVMESMHNEISGLHKRFDSLASTEFVHIKDDVKHLFDLINTNRTQLESRIESNKRNDSIYTKQFEQMYLELKKTHTNYLNHIYYLYLLYGGLLILVLIIGLGLLINIYI